MEKIKINTFQELKDRGQKIVSLTAYDYFTAKFLEDAGIDLILVGDSLNMVVYGKMSTLDIGMDSMIAHTQAVSSAVSRSFVVADMPFMSYQPSVQDAIKNAGRFLTEAGAQAVKLEGGIEMLDRVKAIYNSGIPVLGHIGLMPQSINKYGTYKLQGRTDESKQYLLESAHKLQESGCFGIVLEKVEEQLARKITEELAIPTIGIGSGPYCDGQILVVNDILGLFDTFKPTFAKQYANLKEIIKEAASNYREDVLNGQFPVKEDN